MTGASMAGQRAQRTARSGWSRARAREFALAHSPMPGDFVDAEIDRYIALPGQARSSTTDPCRFRCCARS